MKLLISLLVSCLLLESGQLQAQPTGTYYPVRRFTFDVTPRPRAAQGIMVGEVTPTKRMTDAVLRGVETCGEVV